MADPGRGAGRLLRLPRGLQAPAILYSARKPGHTGRRSGNYADGRAAQKTTGRAMHLICLHNVIPGPVDAFDRKCARISVAEFEGFLDKVAVRFDLVSYNAYMTRLVEGQTSTECLALSFDDGFLGVFDHALPVLQARGLTAVAFVNPPFLGNPADRIFHFLEIEIAFRLTRATRLTVSFAEAPFDLGDETARIEAMRAVKKALKTRSEAARAAGHAEVLDRLAVPRADILALAGGDPKFRVMDTAEVWALAGHGWTIGSHAMTHRTLAMLPPAERAAEIHDASAAFEALFGWRNLPFAYPYGDTVHVGDDAPAVVAEAGHPVAFTTIPGPSDLSHAPHRLPRIDYRRFLRDFGIDPL